MKFHSESFFSSRLETKIWRPKLGENPAESPPPLPLPLSTTRNKLAQLTNRKGIPKRKKKTSRIANRSSPMGDAGGPFPASAASAPPTPRSPRRRPHRRMGLGAAAAAATTPWRRATGKGPGPGPVHPRRSGSSSTLTAPRRGPPAAAASPPTTRCVLRLALLSPRLGLRFPLPDIDREVVCSFVQALEIWLGWISACGFLQC